MNSIQILVFGKHPEILQTVLRLINKEEKWVGEGSTDEDQVLRLFQQKDHDLILLGGGIPELVEHKLRIN